MRNLSAYVFLVIFGLLLIGNNVWGNTSRRSPYISPNAVELISKRTEFSKTYDNGNGTFTDEYSISPLHFRGSDGQWQDIDLIIGAKKIAYEDSFQVDPNFMDLNAWYNSGTSQYGWSQSNKNFIGYDSSTGIKRQAFRWDIHSFYDDISIDSMMYTFHHSQASEDLDITTCRMSEDPQTFYDDGTAEDFYTWTDWGCPTNYTSIKQNENTGGKVYDVDVTEHHYGIEWRINQHTGVTFFAVLHQIRYENSSRYSDICASSDATGKRGGEFYMTYTIQGRKKIAPSPVLLASPNPFNPSTVITFKIDADTHVVVDIFSVNGQKVATLVDGSVSAGVHAVKFDGSRYGSGLYFYRLASDRFNKTGKMLLLK